MTKRNGNGGHDHNGVEMTLSSCFIVTTSDDAPRVRRAIEAVSRKTGEAAVLDEREMHFTKSTIGVAFLASSGAIEKLEKKGLDVHYNGSCPSPIR